MVEFWGIPYIEYIGSGAGIILVGFIIWLWLRNRSGRIGEEKLEEHETDRLKKDELIAETAQKDEKKQCAMMIKVVDEILETLRKEGMGEIYDQVLGVAASVKVMLRRLRDEKMSEERALDTFKILHANLNEFISKLPTENKTINSLVGRLSYHRSREYRDLINELMMDRDKKATLRRLWNDVLDEERGSGNAAA